MLRPMATKKDETKGKGIDWRVVVGLFGVVAIGAAVAMWVGGSERSWNIFRAWYAETPDGPVVLVERGDFTEATHAGDSRYNRDATSRMALHSHRVDDGAHLGSFEAKDFGVIGVWGDHLWVDVPKSPDRPLLLAAAGLETKADHGAILKAVGDDLGGDFEAQAARYSWDPYTGELHLKGARGKTHLLSTDLELRPEEDGGKIPPEGYDCNVRAADLIEPSLVACLPPQSAPATSLARSHQTAIKRDRPNDKPLLSAVSTEGGSAKLLWSKPLAELAGTSTTPFLSGSQTLDPHRVVLLLRGDDKRLHLVFVDPADGSVLDRKTMFGEASPPGPSED